MGGSTPFCKFFCKFGFEFFNRWKYTFKQKNKFVMDSVIMKPRLHLESVVQGDVKV